MLVHGGNISTETWNRLTVGKLVQTEDGYLGAGCWDGTIAALRAQGHQAFAPALKDERRCHLADHVEQVCSVIVDHDLGEAILVGHSYGGMVITGCAARMPERIRRLVYVDAAVPDPGQSLFDLITAGGRDPLSFAGLEAAAPYVERLEFDPLTIERLQKTYILCTRSEFATVTHVAREKIAASGSKGWTYLELPTSHVPMASLPDEFYHLVLEAAA